MRPPRMDTAQLALVRQPFNDPDFLFELNLDARAQQLLDLNSFGIPQEDAR
jgi:hypothetical protein